VTQDPPDEAERPLGRQFFVRDALVVAPSLLGATVRVGAVSGRITEVEAYRRDDPASHSFRGPTPRNASMFAAPGTLYVYVSYGIHHCANIVTGDPADGQAVLLRAVEIIDGGDVVASRRGYRPQREWANGPGKVCQAFGIDLAFDGLDLVADERMSIIAGAVEPDPVVTTRIGITVGVDRPWRWVARRASASSSRGDGTSPDERRTADRPASGRA
jgi:DNA-3-methyladenine glycosylase